MKAQALTIECEDAYNLGATMFSPESDPKLLIQINSATATPQGYYASFAKYLSKELNAIVVTFDYRGIGKSKIGHSLKGITTEYIDWALIDIPAISSFLKSKYPSLPLIHFGHSVGGQMVGLLPNLTQISGLVTVGSAAGSLKHMKKAYKLKSLVFFELVRPISHFLFGYSKLKSLGLMEDLPKNLVNSWRKWCSVDDYFFDPKYYAEIKPYNNYKQIPFPIEILIASDDEIATPTNVNNFWKHAKSLKGIEISYLKPSEFVSSGIGHFGFFKKKFKESLWPIAIKKIIKTLAHE